MVIELQAQIRARVTRFNPLRWPQLDEIEQDSMVRLCEMRKDPKQALLIQPPLADLAAFLMAAPAKAAARVKQWPRLRRLEEPAVMPEQEAAVTLDELLEIATSLPRGMARTILAQEAYVAGDGPPLEEALGIERPNALRRLARAQEAVMAIANGENVEIGEEDQDD